MIRLSRKHREHTTRGLLATLAGLWLLAAAAPCVVMAQPPVCPPDMTSHHYPHENQPALDAADDCDTLAALNCRLPNPNPPSAALDIPVPAPVLLQTFPIVLDVIQADRLSHFAHTTVDPPTPLLNRKQSRLLI